MRSDVVDAPVGSEGGRRPSTLSAGHNGAGGATSGLLTPGQRWSVNRKREAVFRLLRGEAAEDLSRELGVPLYKLERWRRKVEAALDGALKERETDAVSDELATAMQRIGELSMENELLRSRIERPGPLVRNSSSCRTRRALAPMLAPAGSAHRAGQNGRLLFSHQQVA